VDVWLQYEEMREEYFESLLDRRYLTLAQARSKRLQIDFAASPPRAPATPGVHAVTASVRDLVPYIDWNPFFSVWEIRGKYPNRGFPKIFDDAEAGAEARKLYNDASAMLERAADEGWFTVRQLACHACSLCL
jgi:5-methyltetrahydrofolate--homocysteine methyltransferase